MRSYISNQLVAAAAVGYRTAQRTEILSHSQAFPLHRHVLLFPIIGLTSPGYPRALAS